MVSKYHICIIVVIDVDYIAKAGFLGEGDLVSVATTV